MKEFPKIVKFIIRYSYTTCIQKQAFSVKTGYLIQKFFSHFLVVWKKLNKVSDLEYLALVFFMTL